MTRREIEGFLLSNGFVGKGSDYTKGGTKITMKKDTAAIRRSGSDHDIEVSYSLLALDRETGAFGMGPGGKGMQLVFVQGTPETKGEDR